MKEIEVVSWKLPPHKCLAKICMKFCPSENNPVNSSGLMWAETWDFLHDIQNMYTTQFDFWSWI